MDDQTWLASRAKHMRRHLENAEVIVWSVLKSRSLGGHKFRRQHVVGRAVLDFYCPERRLAVEIDGPTHCEADDLRRDRLLAAAGIEVVRITNEDVYENLDAVMCHVLERLEARSSFIGHRRRS